MNFYFFDMTLCFSRNRLPNLVPSPVTVVENQDPISKWHRKIGELHQ